MAQGDFTKEEAAEQIKTVEDMFQAIPKGKRMEYIGHLNDVSLFIEAARRAAPAQKKGK